MSRPCKWPKSLQPGEISELILDTDSDEERVSSDVSSIEGDICLDEGGAESVPGLSQPLPYHQTASHHECSSSISSSATDEEDAGENVPGEQTQQPITLHRTRPSCRQSGVAHTYTEGPRGKNDNEASHINYGTSPLSIFFCILQKLSLCWWWRKPLLQ